METKEASQEGWSRPNDVGLMSRTLVPSTMALSGLTRQGLECLFFYASRAGVANDIRLAPPSHHWCLPHRTKPAAVCYNRTAGPGAAAAADAVTVVDAAEMLLLLLLMLFLWLLYLWPHLDPGASA